MILRHGGTGTGSLCSSSLSRRTHAASFSPLESGALLSTVLCALELRGESSFADLLCVSAEHGGAFTMPHAGIYITTVR